MKLVVLYIRINREEKLTTLQGPTHQEESLDERFRSLEEETNITNDENRDLVELDFTVEESECVEVDSDN